MVFLVDNSVVVLIHDVTITFFARFLQNGSNPLIRSTLFNNQRRLVCIVSNLSTSSFVNLGRVGFF